MQTLAQFLRDILLRGPQELLVGFLRLLMLLVLIPMWLLARLVKCLCEFLRTTNLYPEEQPKYCDQIPEPLVRRPDPCIYSQTYLASQGLPVTWDNPDIWVALASNPTAIEPDSFHLKGDTDYIVFVQVHNASTDAAIGVRVRLVYRPWSFNSPDLVPVETDASGHEVFNWVNIAPVDATITQFKWHTPKVDPGQTQHFCLQAHLSHPMDTNPANNIGQENTIVHGAALAPVSPGDIAELEVPLFNARGGEQQIRFRFDRYEINFKDTAQLRLKVVEGSMKLPLADRLLHTVPVVNPLRRRDRESGREQVFGKVDFRSAKLSIHSAKTKYEGFEGLRQQVLDRDYSLPEGTVTVDNVGEALRLAPRSSFVTKFQVKIPADVPPGSRLPINLVAEDAAGVVVGGVTAYFDVVP
jgi:hypothetical protein